MQASSEEIKAAFKRKALLYHPDRSHHPRASTRFITLQKAYEILKDRSTRAEYDKALLHKLFVEVISLYQSFCIVFTQKSQ